MSAETPEQYYRRMTEPYDFDPCCDIRGCQERATQGVRCRKCGAVVVLLCGAHAGRAERDGAGDRVKCGCGAWGAARDVLEYRPLSEWAK